MVTNIIQIGNSKGIILPSEILKQLRLSLKSTVSVPMRMGMMSCLSLMCLRMKSLRIGHGRTVWSVLGRVRPYPWG